MYLDINTRLLTFQFNVNIEMILYLEVVMKKKECNKETGDHKHIIVNIQRSVISTTTYGLFFSSLCTSFLSVCFQTIEMKILEWKER